jgi:endonuclease/exonuclease/phosphatase (EEP) superfamily protein YafD
MTSIADTDSPTQPPGAFMLAAARFARVVAALTLLAIAAGWLGRHQWLLELTTHFRFQCVFALTIAAATLALAGSRRQAAILALLAILQSVAMWPLYFSATDRFTATDRPSAGATTYRAVAINVLAMGNGYDQVKAFIQSESPDFVVLAEITDRWTEMLEELKDEYPYSKIDAQADNFGIALLSRIEPERMELFRVGRGHRSAVVGQFILDGQTLSIVGAHPFPPRGEVEARIRVQQLKELANVVGWQQGEVLLLGDLNTTSWSPHFADLIETTGLSDSRQGYGRLSTWPSVLPAFMRIAIDHALLSDGVRVHDRRVGPYVGSDHLPIVLDFSLKTHSKSLSPVFGGEAR